MGVSLPLLPTVSRTTDSDRVAGGLLPAEAGGAMPLPVVRRIWLGPSDTRPPPDCQIPDIELWSVPAPASSDHMVVMLCVVVETPTTMPR